MAVQKQRNPNTGLAIILTVLAIYWIAVLFDAIRWITQQ
jgi:hypothetical protein